MPIIRANEIDIYYEIHGEGEPVVLIAGLNSDHTLYRGILPRLAASYQVIVFDNRGVGQTDKPDIPYTIEMLADDTTELLDALGEIRVPTLILHGRKDKSAPYQLAEEMHAGIKGSTMMTFKGGHIFFILRLQQFLDAILDFYATH